jgi:hypothetical protein
MEYACAQSYNFHFEENKKVQNKRYNMWVCTMNHSCLKLPSHQSKLLFTNEESQETMKLGEYGAKCNYVHV